MVIVMITITVSNKAIADVAVNNIRKKAIFKNCSPFTGCITEINNTQVDNTQNIDIAIPMYSFIKYSDAYSKT